MTLQQLIQTIKEMWIVLDSRIKEVFGYFGFVVATGNKILRKGEWTISRKPQSNGIPMHRKLQRARCALLPGTLYRILQH
eukprot:8151671-Ditylum_brightwellii.AAC.1